LKEQEATKASAALAAAQSASEHAAQQAQQALVLQDNISKEAGALKQQLTLKDRVLNEALALQDSVAKEAESLKQQLVLLDSAAVAAVAAAMEAEKLARADMSGVTALKDQVRNSRVRTPILRRN
jgi:hypothetical protein